jgi:hypothetical protein
MIVVVISIFLFSGCPDAPGNDDPPPESCSNTLDDGYIYVLNEYFINSWVFVHNDDFEHAMDVTNDYNCWNARISSDTDRDVFKIRLKAGHNRIRLTNLTDDLELSLHNSLEWELGSSKNSGTLDEVIDITPPEDGDYYIVVFGYQISTSDYIIIISRP